MNHLKPIFCVVKVSEYIFKLYYSYITNHKYFDELNLPFINDEVN